jgi:hypothetical protein
MFSHAALPCLAFARTIDGDELSSADKKLLQAYCAPLVDADPASLLDDDTLVKPPNGVLNADGTVDAGTIVLHFASVPHGAPRANEGREVYFGMICPVADASYASDYQYHPMYIGELLYGIGSTEHMNIMAKYEQYERTKYDGKYSVLDHYVSCDEHGMLKKKLAAAMLNM